MCLPVVEAISIYKKKKCFHIEIISIVCHPHVLFLSLVYHSSPSVPLSRTEAGLCMIRPGSFFTCQQNHSHLGAKKNGKTVGRRTGQWVKEEDRS